MTTQEFELILDRACDILTLQARSMSFQNSKQFENQVRKVMDELTQNNPSIIINYDSPAQEFPDITMGEFGIEVKYTTSDSWRSIANSILETQRAKGILYIYIVFGKMGGVPEVRWGKYESSIIHVRTSHVPRFEVEMAENPRANHKSLFTKIGISYDEFRKLNMSEKMKYIRAYARKIHPDGRLWWIEDKDEDEHTLPIQARLYTNLTAEEKTRLRAEAALICPKIVKSSRDRSKYDDVVLYLLTYHGVLCHQARDLFSAGSVANPQNDDNGGIYIERALKLIQEDMKKAALEMKDEIFIEYWGESVPPEKRIKRWLEKADKLAKGWTPSKSLFKD